MDNNSINHINTIVNSMKTILLKYYNKNEPPPIIATMAVDMEGKVEPEKPKPIIATMEVDMEGEVKPKPIIATMDVAMNGKVEPEKPKPIVATMAVDMEGKVKTKKTTPTPIIATMAVDMNGKMEPEKPKPIIATMEVDMEGKVEPEKPKPIIATMEVDMEGEVKPKPIIATMDVAMNGKVEPEKPKPIVATMAVDMEGEVKPKPTTPTTPIIATMEVNMLGKIEPSGVGDTFIITDKTANKSWSTSPQMIFDTITFEVIKRETVVVKPSTNFTLYLISGTTSDLDETTGKQKTHYFIVNEKKTPSKIDIYYTLYQKDIPPNVFDFINNEEKAITTFETICGVSQKNNGNFDEYIYQTQPLIPPVKHILLLDIRQFVENYIDIYNNNYDNIQNQLSISDFFENLKYKYPQINPIQNLSIENENDINLITNTTNNIELLIYRIEEIIKLPLKSDSPVQITA